MTIVLNDGLGSDKFDAQHHVHTRTADDRELFTLTGIVLLHWKSEAGGRNWRRESELILGITVPGIPEAKVLQLDFWAPFLTLNAISNEHTSNWPGWAVDWFNVRNPRNPIFDRVTILSQIAGRDSDGWILRLGYNITLAGRFVDDPAGPG